MDHFSKASTGALTGLRVLANLSIVVSHALLVNAFAMGAPTWYKTVQDSRLAVILFGMHTIFAMNTFMSLTALLAAAQLVPRLQTSASPKQVIWQYYVRRFQRLAPAFYALLIIHAAIWLWEGTGKRNANPEANEIALNLYKNPHILRWLPTEFLFLSNVLPDWRICRWTWNLKVQTSLILPVPSSLSGSAFLFRQADFYLLFPLLLQLLQPKVPGFRTRLACVSLAMWLFALIYRALATVALNIYSPAPFLAVGNAGKSAVHSEVALREFTRFFNWIWAAFAGRCSDFGAGILVYLCISHPTHMTMRRRCGFQIAFWSAAAITAAAILLTPNSLIPEPDLTVPLTTRVLAATIPLTLVIPFAVTSVMAYITAQPDATARRIASALSHPLWQPLADRTYSCFLIHLDFTCLVFKFVPVVRWLGPLNHPTALLVLPVCVYVASLLAACVLDAGLAKLAATLWPQGISSSRSDKEI